MKVRLMLTCLCDAFYGEVGIATVRVLDALGCEVAFDDRQTCCGQPPFNAGDWGASRKIVAHWKSVFGSDLQTPVVTPSGSCAAMVRDGYSLLFPDESFPPTYELGEFLVKVLGIDSLPNAKLIQRKVAFHGGCHGRAIGLRDEHRTLIGSIPGVTLVDIEQPEQCCGFGGAFAATQGQLSQGIGKTKLACLIANAPDEILTTDMGCGMHLNGLAERSENPVRVRHFAEFLAEAIA